MSNSKRIHTDEQLRFATRYFVYHLKMYVETLRWLSAHTHPDGWDTVRNSVLETHLVHERILINFLCKTDPDKKTDVIAMDFFHDCPDDFIPLKDDFLNNQAVKIGGQLVHLTIKAMPLLKSDQERYICETEERLLPSLKNFLSVVKEIRFDQGVRIKCEEYLRSISVSNIPISAFSST